MTARPLDPESRRRHLSVAVALVLVMVAVLLAAGAARDKQFSRRNDGKNDKGHIAITDVLSHNTYIHSYCQNKYE